MSYESFPTVFPTETFESVISAIAHINSVLLTVSFTVLVWVCLTKSPAAMSGYKWFILINATSGIIYEYFYTSTQPQLLWPYPINVMSGGFLSTITWSDTSMIIYNDFCYGILFTSTYTNTLLFVYRYGQTVDGWVYRRILSSGKISALVFVTPWLILLCPLVIPPHLYAIPKSQLIEVVRKLDTKLYERIKDVNAIGGTREQFRVANRFLLTFVAIWGLIMLAVTSFCTTSCYRFLRQNRDRLSERTRSLYLILINILVLELFIGILVCGIPIGCISLAYLIKLPFGSYFLSVSIRMWSIYPLTSNIIMIWMVRPYREAVKDLLKKFKCVRAVIVTPLNRSLTANQP
ncbi:serpentine type 7TM GPCR chemoreceptor srh domain-containing protein [Ditylenchus destructor]|nr:serpentine type 7TM GPCR chemoreceptor srh domain-containing protein [Ditylenchus destructor]